MNLKLEIKRNGFSGCLIELGMHRLSPGPKKKMNESIIVIITMPFCLFCFFSGPKCYILSPPLRLSAYLRKLIRKWRRI